MRSQEDIEHEKLDRENNSAICRALALVSAESLRTPLAHQDHAVVLSIQFWEGIRRHAVVMLEGLCEMQGRDLKDLHEHLAKVEKG